MTYFLTKQLSCSFEEAIPKVTEALKSEGFGVLTEIDIKETLKKKLNVDFRKYLILGACNPLLAHRALQAEPNVGLMLPCNVVIQEAEAGSVEVAAIDPVAMMGAVENSQLVAIASEVKGKLEKVMNKL